MFFSSVYFLSISAQHLSPWQVRAGVRVSSVLLPRCFHFWFTWAADAMPKGHGHSPPLSCHPVVTLEGVQRAWLLCLGDPGPESFFLPHPSLPSVKITPGQSHPSDTILPILQD